MGADGRVVGTSAAVTKSYAIKLSDSQMGPRETVGLVQVHMAGW